MPEQSNSSRLEISLRTYRRWEKTQVDLRRGPIRAPANKLSNEERQRVLDLCCNSEFRDKTPREIVPTLADRGIFVASKSTFYRVLRREKLLAHRLSSDPPKHAKPKELIALAPNQVWSWDITYLRRPVLGIFYYLSGTPSRSLKFNSPAAVFLLIRFSLKSATTLN